MTEKLISNLAQNNIHELAECGLMISIGYIAIIILLSYFGQRTRTLTPFTQPKIKCQMLADSEIKFCKHKTGNVSDADAAREKRGADFHRETPENILLLINNSTR